AGDERGRAERRKGSDPPTGQTGTPSAHPWIDIILRTGARSLAGRAHSTPGNGTAGGGGVGMGEGTPRARRIGRSRAGLGDGKRLRRDCHRRPCARGGGGRNRRKRRGPRTGAAQRGTSWLRRAHHFCPKRRVRPAAREGV